jgi:hypothetical protein
MTTEQQPQHTLRHTPHHTRQGSGYATRWDDYKMRLALSEEPGRGGGIDKDRLAVKFFALACAVFTLSLVVSFVA